MLLGQVDGKVPGGGEAFGKIPRGLLECNVGAGQDVLDLLVALEDLHAVVAVLQHPLKVSDVVHGHLQRTDPFLHVGGSEVHVLQGGLEELVDLVDVSLEDADDEGVAGGHGAQHEMDAKRHLGHQAGKLVSALAGAAPP
jgi:hypothetical protein